jgi:hypothetical protein
MNVLLIDDDPGLRRSIRLALETMKHHISEAADVTCSVVCAARAHGG